jgi:hypothetical protein
MLNSGQRRLRVRFIYLNGSYWGASERVQRGGRILAPKIG